MADHAPQGANKSPDTEQARGELLASLCREALVLDRVVLASGQRADYYIDAKRALLTPGAFQALGALILARARELGATAVGGLTMGADPVACAALAAADRDTAIKAFCVRKVRKEHGLQRWVEGPLLEEQDRCLVVEDVVTTGTSTLKAIERLRQERLRVVGAVAVVDRLAGGGEAIASVIHPAPYSALFTIDELYPQRPDQAS